MLLSGNVNMLVLYRLRVAKQKVATSFDKDIEAAKTCFVQAVQEGPHYVCTCCHRLMYRKTVVEFKPIKYLGKLTDDIYQSVFSPDLLQISAQGVIWVCKTCDCSLKQGKMPAQAKANNLFLDDIPQELSDLNEMEIRLISLRIPFMKMVALPCGKQRAIHGPAVNVPTDLNPVCELLPRLPSQAQLVPMKLKRKLCYKGHYMYSFVRPGKIMAALEWLKANNALYKDVEVNMSWEDDAARDDSELWEAVSSQQESFATTVPTDAIGGCPDEGLASLAQERGYSILDVPHDGNCLFSTVQYQLRMEGVDFQRGSLRQQLVDYLEDHPYAHDGCTHLRTFLPAPHDPSAHSSSSADTELAGAEDRYVESVEDLDTRLQLRWCKYLQGMGSTVGGDHVVVQCLADMLRVDIVVIATRNPNMERIKSCYRPARAVLHLSLIGQFHYVSLVPLNTTGTAVCESMQSVPETQEDQELCEDEEEVHHQSQLRGLPYDTVMHREDGNACEKSVISIAPGEGQKPIAILTDDYFEEMGNPTKYHYGNFGLKANRQKRLTVHKYFNQRLLNADGRFAKDVEYLLMAQYAVESKQVFDDASIVLWQSQGWVYRGQAIKAGTYQRSECVTADDAER